jgi:hypothetical protein
MASAIIPIGLNRYPINQKLSSSPTLELSGVGRVMEDGVDEEEARAGRMDKLNLPSRRELLRGAVDYILLANWTLASLD